MTLNVNDPKAIEAAAKELFDERASEDPVRVWTDWARLAEASKASYREEVVHQELLRVMQPFVGRFNTPETRELILDAITPFLGPIPDVLCDG